MDKDKEVKSSSDDDEEDHNLKDQMVDGTLYMGEGQPLC
jgi:hypothetical protein